MPALPAKAAAWVRLAAEAAARGTAEVEAAGTEGPGVQPLDRRGVVRMFGSDDEGQGGHGRRPAAGARR